MKYLSFSALRNICLSCASRALLVTLAMVLLALVVWAPQPAIAQVDATGRLAGLNPRQVLNGSAKLIGPYAPNEKRRLVFGQERPYPAEEEKFLEELHTKGSPNFMG